MLKKSLIIGVALTALLAVSACTRTQQAASVGAIGGGVLGGVATGTATGAVVGAAVGAVAGVLIAEVAGQPGTCWYRLDDGRLHQAPCPQG